MVTKIREMLASAKAELASLHDEFNANNARIQELTETNQQIHIRSVAVAERVNTLMQVSKLAPIVEVSETTAEQEVRVWAEEER
jgi:hypothetical protein